MTYTIQVTASETRHSFQLPTSQVCARKVRACIANHLFRRNHEIGTCVDGRLGVSYADFVSAYSAYVPHPFFSFLFVPIYSILFAHLDFSRAVNVAVT